MTIVVFFNALRMLFYLLSSSLKSTFTFTQTVANYTAIIGASSVAPGATTSPPPVGGASTGISAGGILAAVLGDAGILATVVYFLVGFISIPSCDTIYNNILPEASP